MFPNCRTLFAVLLLSLLLPVQSCIAANELDTLAQNVERTESLRAVKNLQRTYAHYAQYGLWDEMANLFTNNATYTWDTQVIQGKSGIAAWLKLRSGILAMRADHSITTDLIDEPLVNLAADGNTAKGRWMGFSLLGDSKQGARIEGGVYENTYVREKGVWLFSAVHFYPQYAGSYADGWFNWGGKDLPLIPYHFTADETGIPIAAAKAAPASRASLAELEQRITALNDEDAVRNLQHAYGYYLDRKMWDDVADLFASDAKLEIAGIGIYTGQAGVLRALQRMGPQGLQHGQLNDHPLFDTIVKVSKGNREAFARGIELGMLGEADEGVASWEVNVFRNRFVKEAGVWKIREMRLYPVLKADYFKGWVTGLFVEIPPKGATAPDHIPVTHYSAGYWVPAFLDGNTASRKPLTLPPALHWVDATALTDVIPLSRDAGNGNASAEQLAEAKRRLARSIAYDGAENVSAAYGYYSDDCQRPQMGAIFAEHGNMQALLAGYYLGRERITQAVTQTWGAALVKTRPGISYHWRIQPVILVAADGRSANLRTRLFQPRTGKELSKPGAFYAAGFHGGMYPNDQVVLEKDIWRLWSLTTDEPYFTSTDWQGGWAMVKDRKPDQTATPGTQPDKFPPDIALAALGKREEHFQGGIGTTIAWPGILPMWFNYRNPVSGRTPENYWPDCVPCEQVPAAKMTAHGYLMPPSGAPVGKDPR